MTKALWIYPLVVCAAIAVALARGPNHAPVYTADGGIAKPDYRKWVFLGSGLGMSYTGHGEGNPPFTNVFAEPSAYDQYMHNGVWPDKTVLVAERRASATTLSINKSGFAQVGDALGAEIEVKDASRGGWLFFEVPPGASSGKLLPKSAACYDCHQQHAAVDNTFVQFYPSLIEIAKRKGTYRQSID